MSQYNCKVFVTHPTTQSGLAIKFCAIKLLIFTFGLSGFTSLASAGGEKVYNDSHGIQWTSDSFYIESGEINTPSPQPGINGALDYPLQHLCSFPQGKRNCYVLPVTQGKNT
ncbi:hypothetical protein SUGI_0962070 [Cryptomeria japonica]|nr:hypothetical protein SUGI_0962070 [Cryptomeria japonica]